LLRAGYSQGNESSDAPPLALALADEIWLLIQRRPAHRLVLDLDQFDLLPSYLLGRQSVCGLLRPLQASGRGQGGWL
jgi:hypothetical protein